jgi:hypothetical protein
MKACLVPLYFDPGRDQDFDMQLERLNALLSDEAEFLEPLPLGYNLPKAKAVVFPQLLGGLTANSIFSRTSGCPS